MATIRCWKLALWASIVAPVCGLPAQQVRHAPEARSVQRSERFLVRRGFGHTPGNNLAELLQRARAQHRALAAASTGTTPLNAPWISLGPSAVATTQFGLVSGRVTSIAADPSDASGNTVYVGTTGGGVWKSTNAASVSPMFAPLTDTLPTSSGCSTPTLASLSIGALTVQPGGTGVVLAGTGDPNDALDSYYGTGILRSTDNGNTWCLIPNSMDGYNGSLRGFSFRGLGFAGFAWSTVNPQLVVAAVAQSAEGVAVNAESASSFAGLYYSTDAGKTWLLATITDGTNKIIQSSQTASTIDPGNSVTSVTWNPVRKRFYAAVRYHGYYESPDGMTWTRLDNQPGANLFPAQCPAIPDGVGSPECPIFRGTIVSQPVTGDLFAISIDNTDSDQGLWQDVCNPNSNGCASATVTFSNQIQDAAIDIGGGTVIPQGDYDLTLAAVPSQQDTLLFVGTRDVFRCSLANSCAWRNTTNVDSCAAARVAPSQHDFDTTFSANGLMYFGNDGGIWRTMDAVSQPQPTCSSDDAAHFQNLNSGIGSLAEVASFSQHPQNENVLMAAMGAFGTAATQTASGTWAQILDGEGDANAIDPANPQNWYTTSAVPIAIHVCTQGTSCDKAGFGSPVIANMQVGNDGYGLTGAAPWILDPQNTANLIVGTCRIWRGPAANGSTSSGDNAISLPLDAIDNAFCNGNAQIRSLAASGSPADPLGTSEKIYAGMAGSVDGGATVPGHIYRAIVSGFTGIVPSWADLSDAPVINSPAITFNAGGFDISSIYVDPHDSTGNTLYVTIQGFVLGGGSHVYRSRDGGASWIAIGANLPTAPANSILVDPNDANTVYVALDTGVYVTRNINLCTDSSQNCWSVLGTGLPEAPVTQLRAYSYLTTSLLRAATYGRGIWQIPLVTSGVASTTASLTPATLIFASQPMNTVSEPQTVSVKNTGTVTLTITSIAASENFAELDNCSQPLPPGSTCNIETSFAPTATGALQGVLTVYGNVPTGQITVALTGDGLVAGNIVLLPGSINFGSSLIGTATPPQNITISNTGGGDVSLQAPATSGDFQISANTCGTTLPPNTGCTVAVTFNPTAAGGRTGVFSIHDDEGTQTVQLSGNGQAAATALLSGTSLNFSQQTVGTRSAPQQVTLTNNGDVSLTDVTIGVSGDFTAQNNCGSYLIGHSSCAISVVFVPSRVGAENGSLAVNTVLGAQTVSLAGTGQAPSGISALPATLDFGSQGVHSTSSSQRVVLTNSGGYALTGLTFSVDGDFAVSGGTCASGGTLNAQSACEIDLAFTPAQTGLRSGFLIVGAANLASPPTVLLSGTGADFQLGVSGSASAVIVAGQTATYAIQTIPVSGSSGTLILGCTGAPQDAVCTVNPATLPLASGVTGYATVTVTTGASSASAFPFNGWQRTGIALAALLPCALFGIRKRHLLLRGWLICLLVTVLFIPVACGVHATGGGTTPGGSTQPSGVYTLTITASMPGLQRSVPLTLTVQ